jgi:hypothetical protein
MKITVKTKDGDEKTFSVAADADLGKMGKDKDKARTLKALAAQVEKSGERGVGATITTAKKGGKDTVTKVEVRGGRRGGKDKDK